jgi:hypothetical protein
VTVTDWVLVVIAGGWVAIVLALVWLIARATRAVDSVIDSVRNVTDETVPILQGVNETVSGVNVELARVDTIVGGVQSITVTTDQLVGVVHATLSNPLIKMAAFAAGVAQATRRLRR